MSADPLRDPIWQFIAAILGAASLVISILALPITSQKIGFLVGTIATVVLVVSIIAFQKKKQTTAPLSSTNTKSKEYSPGQKPKMVHKNKWFVFAIIALAINITLDVLLGVYQYFTGLNDNFIFDPTILLILFFLSGSAFIGCLTVLHLNKAYKPKIIFLFFLLVLCILLAGIFTFNYFVRDPTTLFITRQQFYAMNAQIAVNDSLVFLITENVLFLAAAAFLPLFDFLNKKFN